MVLLANLHMIREPYMEAFDADDDCREALAVCRDELAWWGAMSALRWPDVEDGGMETAQVNLPFQLMAAAAETLQRIRHPDFCQRLRNLGSRFRRALRPTEPPQPDATLALVQDIQGLYRITHTPLVQLAARIARF